AVEELHQRLIEHGVIGDGLHELVVLCLIGQFYVQQQIGDLQERRFFGKLLDGVAAIGEQAVFAVDVGDVGAAAAGGGEGRVEREHALLRAQIADINGARAGGTFDNRQLCAGALRVGQLENVLCHKYKLRLC